MVYTKWNKVDKTKSWNCDGFVKMLSCSKNFKIRLMAVLARAMYALEYLQLWNQHTLLDVILLPIVDIYRLQQIFTCTSGLLWGIEHFLIPTRASGFQISKWFAMKHRENSIFLSVIWRLLTFMEKHISTFSIPKNREVSRNTMTPNDILINSSIHTMLSHHQRSFCLQQMSHRQTFGKEWVTSEDSPLNESFPLKNRVPWKPWGREVRKSGSKTLWKQSPLN